jgi:hypothetical protein
VRNFTEAILLTQKPSLAHFTYGPLYLIGLAIGFIVLGGALAFLAFSL